jgi:hypothetical protein
VSGSNGAAARNAEKFIAELDGAACDNFLWRVRPRFQKFPSREAKVSEPSTDEGNTRR